MLMIRLKAAKSVSVMLLANPHQAKRLVSRMNGKTMLVGTKPGSFAPTNEASVWGAVWSSAIGWSTAYRTQWKK
jgi:hypothetical protein